MRYFSMLLVAGSMTTVASGASHLWRFNEVFSSADGTVQFIELKECCGADNETFIANKDIRSDAIGLQYWFPENLPCTDCTANKHLLLATQAFADLPGAPTPDFIIPEGMFAVGGDTLRYWLYTQAVWTFGAIPLDGVNSMNVGKIDFTAPNSPTNFADETGSIIVPCHPADLDASGDVGTTDLLELLGNWGDCPGCSADLNDDDVVDTLDLLAMLGAWGSC